MIPAAADTSMKEGAAFVLSGAAATKVIAIGTRLRIVLILKSKMEQAQPQTHLAVDTVNRILNGPLNQTTVVDRQRLHPAGRQTQSQQQDDKS